MMDIQVEFFANCSVLDTVTDGACKHEPKVSAKSLIFSKKLGLQRDCK
jgi:hypothetical protein